MFQLSMEYIALVFLAVVGVLQLAAMHGCWNKLVFFQNRLLGHILSVLLVIAPLILLFTWNYRNATGIIQGTEQAGLFVLSMVLAILFTLVLSSALNHSEPDTVQGQKEGLEVLKGMTYLKAISRLLSRKE